MMVIDELAIIQGECLVQVGFDIYHVDLDSECGTGGRDVKRLEWVSPTELMIVVVQEDEPQERVFKAVFEY